MQEKERTQTELIDVQTAVKQMGIEHPEKRLLAQVGRRAAKAYRAKHGGQNPPKISATIYGRQHDVYVYESDGLLLATALIEQLFADWKRGDPKSLGQLRTMQDDYDMLMLGILDACAWKWMDVCTRTLND